MKHQWLSRSDRPELTLVFAGWGLGSAPFVGLTGAGNTLLVQDYTQIFDPLPVGGFERIGLLAFSFGVASAAHWLAHTGIRPDHLVAVSGTLHPASADFGIAPEVIRATADNLSDASFAKFCRRAGMGGKAPALDVAAAQAELLAVIERGHAPDPGFDRVWIPQRDRVIPTAAQEAAWVSHPDIVRRIDAPHVPFAAGQSWAEWFA